MSTNLISSRISKPLARKLEELASESDRPKSYHIEQALWDYVDVALWQVRQIQEGLKELDEGKGIPHDKVMTEFRGWIVRRNKKSHPVRRKGGR